MSVSVGVGRGRRRRRADRRRRRAGRPRPLRREAPRPRPGRRRVAVTAVRASRRYHRRRCRAERSIADAPTEPSPSRSPHDEDAPADVLADEAAPRPDERRSRPRLPRDRRHPRGQGRDRFKTIAYHRAADAIGRSPIDLVAAYRAGNPPKVPGVGQAISDKITRARDDRPDGLSRAAPRGGPARASSSSSRSRASGPRPSASSTRSSGSRRWTSLRGGREAAGSGRSRGLSERTEQLILEGIERLGAAADAGCSSTRRRSTSRR